MFQHSRSIIRYPRECRDPHLRLLPTAGVCQQRLGTFLRLLLTAGVCERRLGAFLRLLLTAGVCEQRLGATRYCEGIRQISFTLKGRKWTFWPFRGIFRLFTDHKSGRGILLPHVQHHSQMGVIILTRKVASKQMVGANVQ